MLATLPVYAACLLAGMMLAYSTEWSQYWLAGLVLIPWLLYQSWGSTGRILGWLLLGLLWPLLWLQPYHLQIPTKWENQTLLAEGWIASIPEPAYRSTRFELADVKLQHDGHTLPLQGRLQLSWYNAPALQAGQGWRISVRLRRPRGFRNPGSLDYERLLFIRQIAATGTVNTATNPELLPDKRYPVTQLRQKIHEQLHTVLTSHSMLGILSALAIGERQAISQHQWQVLNATGTTHLMAISGLHIGLVAGLLYGLIFSLWSRITILLRYCPAPKATMLLAWIGACGYAALAGFALPTQRALLMLAVLTLAVLCTRLASACRVLALALISVLLYDPTASLSAGFWLSFGAVAVLTYLLFGRQGKFWPRAIVLQLGLSLALIPATLWFFQYATLIAPLANLIAIPWVSVMVVPFTLLGAVCSLFSDTLAWGLWQLAGQNMEVLWWLLGQFSQLDGLQFRLPAPPLWTLPFALFGMVLLLAPRGWPGRWLGLLLCLPLFTFEQSEPDSGTAWFTLLDVGNGLAAVVRTEQHVLVYDTGARLGADLDAGKAVIIPFLRQQGISKIDVLIVSHASAHHYGGVRSLQAAFPIQHILTGTPDQISLSNAQACEQGILWHWEGVSLKILHPPAKGYWRDQAASCVLLVETGGQRLLLMGDLEQPGLATIKPYLSDLGHIDILVPPHHGWRTLPEADWLAHLQPDYVLFASRYRNRYGYPRAATKQQYPAAQLLNTAHSGAIQFVLGSKPLHAVEYRQQNLRYWHTP